MPVTQEEIIAGIAEIIEEVTGIEPSEITPEKSFVDDLDIDSLSMVEIAVQTEDKYGVNIPTRTSPVCAPSVTLSPTSRSSRKKTRRRLRRCARRLSRRTPMPLPTFRRGLRPSPSESAFHR